MLVLNDLSNISIFIYILYSRDSVRISDSRLNRYKLFRVYLEFLFLRFWLTRQQFWRELKETREEDRNNTRICICIVCEQRTFSAVKERKSAKRHVSREEPRRYSRREVESSVSLTLAQSEQ